MNHGPTALYDDLAIEPDTEFARVLRRQLDRELRSGLVQQFTLPADIDVDVPLAPLPEPHVHEQRGRSRRSFIAVAAAIAASIAVGVVVDRLVVDDDTETPATVPTPTSLPTTLPVQPTTIPTPPGTDSSFEPDAAIAFDAMLGLSDVGADTIDMSRPVTLNGTVAAALPACRRFASTVFESNSRPAWIRSRVFQMHTNADVAMQYLAVLPTEAEAAAMLDAIQEPAFLDGCVSVYRSVVPTVCCENLPYWFPFFTGEELLPPAIDVRADDVWVRSWRGSWSGPGGADISASHPFLFAAIRVGRIVTLVDVMLEDDEGNTLATVGDFQRIVQHMASRAADAQAVS